MNIQDYFPNLSDLVKEFGTPFYLYDFSHIQEQYSKLKEAFKARKSLIAYALKANSNLSIVQHIARCGGGADCVSLGEIKKALLAGIKPYKIIYSGVGKQKEEIQEALRIGILFINIESEEELLTVEEIAHKINTVARISIRVNPNIDPKTHPYISTGLSENKFGVSLDDAKRLYLYAHKSNSIQPVGVHFHIGSQITELEPISEAAQKISALMRSLIALGIDINFFDVGGGIGIQYTDEQIFNAYDYAQAILNALQGIEVTVICEPGRFIVGNAGYFITSVLYQKQSESKKKFIIVDGGMNDLIRPTLYALEHRVALFHNGTYNDLCDKKPFYEKSDIVGPICESGDWLARDVFLPPVDKNDIIIIKSAGAYGFSMSSQYNVRPKVAEIAFDNTGKTWLIRSREKLQSLWCDEIDFLTTT